MVLPANCPPTLPPLARNSAMIASLKLWELDMMTPLSSACQERHSLPRTARLRGRQVGLREWLEQARQVVLRSGSFFALRAKTNHKKGKYPAAALPQTERRLAPQLRKSYRK